MVERSPETWHRFVVTEGGLIVETVGDGERVRVTGPDDSEWLGHIGTVSGIAHRGEPEPAVTVRLDADGHDHLFKMEQLERL
jgi:hypothetical protein